MENGDIDSFDPIYAMEKLADSFNSVMSFMDNGPIWGCKWKVEGEEEDNDYDEYLFRLRKYSNHNKSKVLKSFRFSPIEDPRSFLDIVEKATKATKEAIKKYGNL